MTYRPIHTYYQRFHRPFVRDLAYALVCPNVTTHWLNVSSLPAPPIALHSSDFWLTQYHRYLPRLLELDSGTAYQQLSKFLFSRPSPYRLGFHFEGLLAFWLVDGFNLGLHPFELIANNVSLYRDRQTIGELDFVVLNHATATIEHWELAIKFFLGSPPFAPANWQGIHSKDTLARKMRHMQDKQFSIVWITTNTHGKVKIDKRFAVIKGRFFLPLPFLSLPITDINQHVLMSLPCHGLHDTYEHLPDWLNPTLPYHYWTYWQNWTALSTLTEAQTLSLRLQKARYIEWFTQRKFYHPNHHLSAKQTNQSTSLNLKLNNRYQPLQTGLYFYPNRHDEMSQRLVLLNKQNIT